MFHNTSYKIQKQVLDDYYSHGSSQPLPAELEEPNTVEAWMHSQAYELLQPLLSAGGDWLTVGDGRCASGAAFLIRHGVRATASDISTAPLEIAHKMGIIKEYSQQNAEYLTFEDGSFDWVLCKECYHHLPRPAIGFYEMLRVSRKGIVLLEPQCVSGYPLEFIRRLYKKVFRGGLCVDYEPAGNYIYRTSVGELVRMMLAMDLPIGAFKSYNVYHPNAGGGSGRVSPPSMEYLFTRSIIALQDGLSRLSLMGPGCICAVVCKTIPTTETLQSLKRKGFKIKTLPRNPYNGKGSQ